MTTRADEQRGWCYSEASVSSIVKYSKALWDLSSWKGNATKFGRAADNPPGGMISELIGGREPFVNPDDFAAEMRRRVNAGEFSFSYGADAEVVIDMCARAPSPPARTS